MAHIGATVLFREAKKYGGHFFVPLSTLFKMNTVCPYPLSLCPYPLSLTTLPNHSLSTLTTPSPQLTRQAHAALPLIIIGADPPANSQVGSPESHRQLVINPASGGLI
jgi:hypothetical protein